MKLLALETANEQCSISLIDETQELFFQLDTRAKAQTQTILPMIEQLPLVEGPVLLVVFELMQQLLRL